MVSSVGLEYLLDRQGVAGSIPVPPTTMKKAIKYGFFIFLLMKTIFIMRRIFIKPKLFFLIIFGFIFVSCQQKSSSLTKTDINNIEKYLDKKVMNPEFSGKIYSAHKVFMEQNEKIYIWALLQEYYKKNDKTEPGTGWSVPLVLYIEENPNGIIIKNHIAPGDGDLYSEDIKKLFPIEIQQQIFDFSGTEEMRKLEEISKKRSEKL